MTRHEVREAALILMYQMEVNKADFDETLELTAEAYEIKTNSAVIKLINGVCAEKDKLDEIISKYSATRGLTRIAKINLVILRMAIFEMNDSEIPDKVAINEAIELSKEYAFEQDSSFISGLLGNYYKEKNNGV